MVWIIGFPLWLSRAAYRQLIHALVACTGLHGPVCDIAMRICAVLLERALRDREED
jgi:hypothetical protein